MIAISKLKVVLGTALLGVFGQALEEKHYNFSSLA